jgi:hypothetical protein
MDCGGDLFADTRDTSIRCVLACGLLAVNTEVRGKAPYLGAFRFGLVLRRK